MSTGQLLLGLLSSRHHHGYDLKHAYDQLFPAARPLAFGQVYATLERLTKKGHVTPVATEQGVGPERTVYGITPEGQIALQAWLAEVEAPGEFVANPIAAKATITLLTGDEDTAKQFLQAQRATHLERMRDWTRKKTEPEASLALTLAADYALAHLAADLEWLDLALLRLSALLPEQPSKKSEEHDAAHRGETNV